MNNLEKAYVACADVITLAMQLSTSRELPSLEVLQRRLESLFDQMAVKGRELGIPDADVADMRYAVVAFVDEQILKSPWPGRNQWMARPLQLAYYGENTAGEGFFTKMDQISRQPDRTNVLEIYFLCLSLGFQGIYAVRNDYDALGAMVERAASLLGRTLPNAEVISPHGQPAQRRNGGARGDGPLLAIGIACLVLAIGAFVVLKFVLSSDVSATVDHIGTMQGGAGSKSQGGK
jgi:type VI secretion system protein ImpK